MKEEVYKTFEKVSLYADVEISNFGDVCAISRLTTVNFWRVVNLKHELEELTIMEKFGYDYNIAHLMVDKKYPWEYKTQGGWTDDNIQISINERLEALLQNRRS